MPHDRGRRGRSRRLTTVWVALLVAGLLATPSLAADAPRVTADDLGLSAVAGFGGQVVRGHATPVEVRITPDRLVAGELRVLTDFGGRQQSETREVEVSAGAAKVYRFVVPPASGLTIELETDDGLVRTTADADRSSRYLVGVLGSELPDDVPPVRSPSLDVEASVVAVDPTWLDRAPTALDSLSALVLDAGDLAELSEATLDALGAWVVSGADLVVVAADGDLALPLPWSPATGAATTTVVDESGTRLPAREVTPTGEAWVLTAGDVLDGEDATPIAAAINAGKGRVTVVGAAPGEDGIGRDGRLWGLVAPPHSSSSQIDEGGPFGRVLDVAPQTLQTGGIDLPGLPGLALFVIAFVLVVGPLNGFVLARLGRQELSWLTIPAITVVFGIAAWAGAGATSPAVGLSGTAAWWIDDVGGETAVIGVRSPREGVHEVALPGPAWSPAYATWDSAASIDRSSGDTLLRLDLSALELGTIVATRPAEAAPPLAVEVSERSADELTVTVRNTSSVTVGDLEVRAGTLSTRADDLAPGASTEVVLRDVSTLRRRNAWEEDVARGPDGVPEVPQALEGVLRWDVLDQSPGVVWAVGTVADTLPGAGALRAGGAATESIGSFVAVGVTPRGLAGDASAVEVTRELVLAGFGEAWRPAPWAVEGSLEAVLRYRLPHVPGADTLVSTLDRGEMFDGGAMEMCFAVELRDPATDELLTATDACGDPSFPPPPPCPPDRSCSYAGDTVEVCDPDGECITAEVVIPELPDLPRSNGLEVWDVTAREWTSVLEAFRGGSAPADRFVSPLGEVLVRAAGQLHPFEFSARGLALTTGTEAGR